MVLCIQYLLFVHFNDPLLELIDEFLWECHCRICIDHQDSKTFNQSREGNNFKVGILKSFLFKNRPAAWT